MATFSETIFVNAPRSAVWAVLADIGRIHEWNPGVVASRKTTVGEDGPGAGRRCELGGKNYLDEEVVEWAPERALTMRITATNLPFKAADIRFTIEGHGRQTRVTVSPTYALKFGWLGRLLDTLAVRARYRRGMADLLQGLRTYVENQHCAPDRVASSTTGRAVAEG
jgi:hypothetical protein